MKSTTLACLMAISVAAACARAPATPIFNAARAIDTIRTGEVNWNADWKSGDPGKVAAHYAPQAVVMIPGQAPVTGLEAIRAMAQKSMDDPAFNLAFSSDKVDVAASGDLAASRGTFTLTATDPATKTSTTTTGAFVTVYKPQPDGSWKAVWDIVTPGPAATPAPAAK
ncbi:MAG: YybH family protein [Caulobacteraceae bacterium]